MLWAGQHITERTGDHARDQRHLYVLPIAFVALLITLFFAHAAATPQQDAGAEFGGFTMKNTSLAYGQRQR